MNGYPVFTTTNHKTVVQWMNLSYIQSLSHDQAPRQPNPNDTGAVGGISFTHQLLHQRKTNYASTDSKAIAINANNSTVLFTYTFT